MKYEEVWSFKYQCVRQTRPSRTVQQHFWGFKKSLSRHRGDSTYALEKANVPHRKGGLSEVTFPKVDTSEMEEYGVGTYGSIEGRKAMNKTLASKAILPLTEVPESSSYNALMLGKEQEKASA
jgi:hypothetical protein